MGTYLSGGNLLQNHLHRVKGSCWPPGAAGHGAVGAECWEATRMAAGEAKCVAGAAQPALHMGKEAPSSCTGLQDPSCQSSTWARTQRNHPRAMINFHTVSNTADLQLRLWKLKAGTLYPFWLLRIHLYTSTYLNSHLTIKLLYSSI